MNKLIIFMLVGILSLYGFTFGFAYSQTVSCYTSRILHIIELDGIIQCLDTRITALENASPINGTENTSAINLGSVGEGIFSTEIGDQLQFKSLFNGTGITLSANGTRIMINSTGGSDLTTGSNIGTSGQNIFSSEVGNDLQFKKLHTIDSCLLLTNNSTNVNADTLEQCEDKLIGQSVFDVQSGATKTNIGTVYVDIYTTALHPENRAVIEFTNVTYVQIIYQWDYVGTGTQQCRWVDVSNNANVLYEDGGFTTDRDPDSDTGFFIKPSWATGLITIEWQCKSTVAGDDPIAQGYTIRVK